MTAPAEPPAAPAQAGAKLPMKQRLSKLIADYGSLALYLYLGTGLLMTSAFAIAYLLGVEPSDATGVIGVIVAAWVSNKATAVIRIPIILAITPPIAELLKRRKQRRIAAVGSSSADEQIAALDAEGD